MHGRITRGCLLDAGNALGEPPLIVVGADVKEHPRCRRCMMASRSIMPPSDEMDLAGLARDAGTSIGLDLASRNETAAGIPNRRLWVHGKVGDWEFLIHGEEVADLPPTTTRFRRRGQRCCSGGVQWLCSLLPTSKKWGGRDPCRGPAAVAASPCRILHAPPPKSHYRRSSLGPVEWRSTWNWPLFIRLLIITQLDDPSVGGDQFDDILVDFVSRQILELHSVDIRGDRYAMTMLSEAMEQAKVELSSKSEVTVSIPSFSTSAQGPVDLNITLSRQEFENLVDKLIGDIKRKCQSVLEDAKTSAKDIMEIVLIGGMSRVPKIQRIICEVFGQNLHIKVNPEEAVVIGSAIHAALIVQDEQKITDNMIPLSIGIESSRGIFTRIIPRYSTIPTKQTVKIPAWVAYGERKLIKVFWGEHVMVEHNILLGEIEVMKNRRLPYGCSNLELTFEVDKNFVVKVTAKCDDDDESFFAFPIAQKDRSEEHVKKAVKKALLDWRISSREIHARLKNLARHAVNTLGDVLSAKKDELPDSFYKEAVQVFGDLRKSLDGDIDVLRTTVRSASSLRSKILNWLPPLQYHDSEDADYE
nr:unnamed protein product [Digitaria exilis]